MLQKTPPTRAALRQRKLRANRKAGRHCYTMWLSDRAVEGLIVRCILELPLKVVQARLGHATIQMTADTYGHLFPRSEDGAELAADEKALMR
jgi:integrase